MKKIINAAAVIMMISVLTMSSAHARDGFYLAARGGLDWNNFNSKNDSVTASSKSDFGRSEILSGAVGYRHKFFRGEFEYITRKDAEEDVIDEFGDVTAHMSLAATSYMFNGYLDFLPNYWISPYISAGIGWSEIELTHEGVGASAATHTWKKSAAFTWQAGVGLTLRLNRCLNIDTGYRYFTLGKINNAEVNNHEWYAGLRFTF